MRFAHAKALAGLLLCATAVGIAPVLPALGDDAASEPAGGASTGIAAAAKLARSIFDQLQAKHLDRNLLTPQFDADLNDEALAQLYGLVSSNGSPLEFSVSRKVHLDGETRYVIRVKWTAGLVAMVLGIDDVTGKISALYFRPAADVPGSP
jgi:hypothetical protein